MLQDDGAVVGLNGSRIWVSNIPRVTSFTPRTLFDNDTAGADEGALPGVSISTAFLAVQCRHRPAPLLQTGKSVPASRSHPGSGAAATSLN